MQRHKQAYLNQIKKRYARKIRDQGRVGMPKKEAMAIVEQNMTRTVLNHNYEQFCSVRFKKYKLQYPRMRDSDIVAKFLREWEAFSLKQKLQFKFQDDACDRDSVWSGDDPDAEMKILQRRQKRMKMKKKKMIKKQRKLKSLSNRQRILNFRNSKVRIFISKGIPEQENFRLDDACAKKPWSQHFTDQVERKYEQSQDIEVKIVEKKEKEEEMENAEMEQKKDGKKETKAQMRFQKWQRRQNKVAWKTKKTCYPCWKDNFNVQQHFCLPRNLVQPYQSISSVVPTPGYISIGRRSSNPVLYDPETGKTKGSNSITLQEKEKQPFYVFFPVVLPIFLPKTIIGIDYWVQTFSNTVRGLPVRFNITFPEEFHSVAVNFPLMESDKAIQIQEVIPEYGTSLVKGPQKILFANNFEKGDIFGPIGGQMVPRNMSGDHSIPFNRQFSLVPLFGATLLSFTKVNGRKNVQMIGAVQQERGEAIIYMFFRAMRKIEAFEQIIA